MLPSEGEMTCSVGRDLPNMASLDDGSTSEVIENFKMPGHLMRSLTWAMLEK